MSAARKLRAGVAHAFTLLAIAIAVLVPPRRAKLVWGPTPILSNRYWSCAMREAGWDSVTLMAQHYAINNRSDFDIYFDDLLPAFLRGRRVGRLVQRGAAFIWTIRNAKVVHMPFDGGAIGGTPWWRLEGVILGIKGIRTVVMPYGADAHLYSRIIDPSLRAALTMSYPDAARREAQIASHVEYWTRRADVMITGTMIDGLGRSDTLCFQPCCIDTRLWAPKESYSRSDGHREPVRVIHTPNHRGFKGTQFLLRSVRELQDEGLQVELILLEGVPNDEVRAKMASADILAEQFIASVYALSGIEGMASGLPVLVNLESEAHTRLFRRYSYLDECPALSTSPETLTANLRRLVTDPDLRETLGRAGVEYAQKYHSYATAQYMFGAVYDRMFGKSEIDLFKLFDPLAPPATLGPRIQHPLIESHLPVEDEDAGFDGTFSPGTLP